MAILYARSRPRMTPSAHPVAERRLHPLILTGAALAVAIWAQTAVRARPSASLAGFGVAAVLIAVARGSEPRPIGATPSRTTTWPPTKFWAWFAAATTACVAAAVAVHNQLHPRLSHLTWLAGLLLYGAAAWRARKPSVADEQSDAHTRTRAHAQTRANHIAATLVVALFAAAVFGWHLTSIPPEVHGDDAEVGLDAIDLLGRFNLFATGWFWLPRFHALPTALGLKLFGVDLLGLRFPSFALGLGCVLLLFAVARRLWGLEIAVIAALLLASQRYFIHLSRAGYHYIDTPFLSLLVVWLLLRAWREQRFGAAVCCGVALGLGVQTYYASRLVPVLVVLTFFAWLLSERGRQFGARAAMLGVIAVTALATVAPIGAYFWSHPEDLWRRTEDTSVFGAAARTHLSYGYGTRELGRILLIQARAAFSLFNATADTSVQYGYRAPLFEPVSAALFVLGAALVLADARRKQNQLVLLWTVVPIIAGAVLTIDTPFYPRISGLIPFAVLAVALALGHTLEVVRRAVSGVWGRRLSHALAAVAVGAIVANNLQSYFVDYAPHHRHSPAVEVSAWIRDHGAGKTAYMVGGAPRLYVRHGAIRFLTWGYATRDLVDLDTELRTRPPDPRTSIFVVLPAGESLIPKLTTAVGGVDMETVRDARGAVAFIGVIPLAAKESTHLTDERAAFPSPFEKACPELCRRRGSRGICSNDSV